MKLATAGVLDFPVSYEVMDNEEMTYVEGGYSNKLEVHWWGAHIYLSHATIEQATKWTTLAAATAGFAAALAAAPSAGTGTVALGIVAGALALASAALDLIDKGNGVHVRYTIGLGITGIWR